VIENPWRALQYPVQWVLLFWAALGHGKFGDFGFPFWDLAQFERGDF
jgi:hypothetical protein